MSGRRYKNLSQDNLQHEPGQHLVVPEGREDEVHLDEDGAEGQQAAHEADHRWPQVELQTQVVVDMQLGLQVCLRDQRPELPSSCTLVNGHELGGQQSTAMRLVK